MSLPTATFTQQYSFAKCTMRADPLNWHSYGGYTEMTSMSSNICYTDQDKLKSIIVHKALSQSCSVNKDKSEQSIVNKNLSQNYSADAEESCSTEEDKRECTIMEHKDAENEVTYDVP